MARSHLFVPIKGSGTTACLVEALRLSRKLRGRSQAETDVVVAVVRLVVVAVRGAAVVRFVEVAAAAQDAVRALWRLTYYFAAKRLGVRVRHKGKQG